MYQFNNHNHNLIVTIVVNHKLTNKVHITIMKLQNINQKHSVMVLSSFDPPPIGLRIVLTKSSPTTPSRCEPEPYKK
jgi:hypothetical protein